MLRADQPGEGLLREFDRLADELEAHLDYEEEQLVAALNDLAFPAPGRQQRPEGWGE